MRLERLLARWKEMRYTGNYSLPSLRVPQMPRRAFLGSLALVGGIAAVGLGYKACQHAVSGSSLEDYLPESFKEIELGMSYQELKELRPFMKPGSKEGYGYERISKESSNYQNILLLFGKNPDSYSYSKNILVRYSFKENQFERIDFKVYKLSSLSQTEGVGDILGKPDLVDKSGFKWHRDKVQVEIDIDNNWFYYTVKKNEEKTD